MNNYDEIYNKYYDKLIVLFNKQVKDKDYVEDLVQETLLKVWNNLDSYDSKYSMSTWVYTIGFNTLKNYFKSKSKESVSYCAEIFDNESTEDLNNPESIMIAAEQEDKYHDTLQSLEKNFLDVYVMKEIDNLSYKDISDQLGIPEGTAKSRLKRARDHIKQELS